MITLSVELEQEDDGRWIAEVTELPGVLAYGENPGDARAKAQALALRVFADRLEHGEAGPDLLSISFKAALFSLSRAGCPHIGSVRSH